MSNTTGSIALNPACGTQHHDHRQHIPDLAALPTNAACGAPA
jgi:hypothetical protein